jgi:hypothetical protein
MPLDIFFADDSIQRNPTRQRMGPLVAAGGIHVPGDRVNNLERTLSQICSDAGFPPGEEFKWSPRRDMWMSRNLIDQAREQFFHRIIQACSEAQAKAVVVVSDTDSRHPLHVQSHEAFVTLLLIERVEWIANHIGNDTIVVFDRPGGQRGNEEDFLETCLETIQSGTPYVRPRRIALNALSTSSHFVRLLQAADVVTSCTTANIAGEPRFAPRVFAAIRPLLPSAMGRIGGVGVKIHPDFWYTNLYHWLLGDAYFYRGNGVALPWEARPYYTSADAF